MDEGELAAAARRVLAENDLGGFTRPAPRQYPHQWNWDSALIAIGLGAADQARAREEVYLVAASAEAASLLEVDATTMLMRLDRTISSSDEAPIEWRIVSCRVRDEYYAAEVN